MPEQVAFLTGSFTCSMKEGPRISCRTSAGASIEFAFRLEPGRCVERIFGVEYEGELIVLYEVSDGLSGWSLSQWIDGAGEATESLIIGAFNLGMPYREGSALYVTAAGLIGRLDLMKRSWVWRHDGLYSTFRVGTSFEAPVRRGENIEFRFRDRPRELVWQDPSGPVAVERDLGPIVVNPETGDLVYARE